jgi:flagellum-specific ATP synthase
MMSNIFASTNEIDDLWAELAAIGYYSVGGTVCSVSADMVLARGISKSAALESRVEVTGLDRTFKGEVVKLNEEFVFIRLYDRDADVRIGARVWLSPHSRLRPSAHWMGRVVNAYGDPLDGRDLAPSYVTQVSTAGVGSLRRGEVSKGVHVGVMAIDVFAPLCFGQRIGIFAGSGLGKSTLLSMIASCASFDAVVVALIGERGREVREFVDTALKQNSEKAITVVATSDESALVRRLATRNAMSIAEHFRDQGHSVLLIVDSITRYAHALREVAISLGEPPIARGYPPSVFSDIAQLLERAGPGGEAGGSITGVISVLIDGDDHNDPVADSVRGILDGHIVLDRAIAEGGRFPAVDLLASVSRLSNKVYGREERDFIRMMRQLINRFEDSRDLRSIGAYQVGVDPELDRAVEIVPKIYAVVSQSPDDPPVVEALKMFRGLFAA